jgi:hypothetical protein
MKKSLPITCAARNAIWIYPQAVTPRFRGAPTIMETTRTHEMPDLETLPEGADVAVELYGKAILLQLDGRSKRIYTERFEFVSFSTSEEARAAFCSLWRDVEALDSPDQVAEFIAAWREQYVA